MDSIAEEVHYCAFCDVQMTLGSKRDQWICPQCFVPKPRVKSRGTRVAEHGQAFSEVTEYGAP